MRRFLVTVCLVACGGGGGSGDDLLDDFRDDSSTPVYGRVVNGIVRDLYGTFPDMSPDAFIATYASAFGVGDPATDLSAPETFLDGTHTATTYHRLASGVRIDGAQIRVHSEGGAVVLVTAQLPSDARIPSATPALTAAEAESAFRTALALDAAVALAPTDLVAYNDGIVSGEAASTVLAYRVQTAGTGMAGFVDAVTGVLVRSYESLLPLRDRRVAHYRPDPGCTTPGCDLGEILAIGRDLWFDEGGSLPDATPTAVGSNLFDAFGDLYAYYSGRFGRDGMNGAGKTVWGILNHPPSASGHIAAYFPHIDALFFRDNAVSSEAVAHEYAHGVIIHSTGLGVQGQAGALNESLADLLAVFATGGVEWDIRLRDDELVRDLAAPPLDHYDGYTSSTGTHRGSGVFSLAGYLLVNGGSHPMRGGPSVAPVALAKVEQIVYRAINSQYIQPSSDLTDGLFGLVRACVDFAVASAYGIEVRDCGSLWNAFASVGLGDWDQDLDSIPDSVDNCPAVYNPSQGDCVGDPVLITHCTWFDRETGDSEQCIWFSYEEQGCDLADSPVRITGDPRYPTFVLLDRPAIYRQISVVQISQILGNPRIFGLLSDEALPDIIQYGTYLAGAEILPNTPEVAPPLEEFGLYEVAFTVGTDGDISRQAGMSFMVGGPYSLEDCFESSH